MVDASDGFGVFVVDGDDPRLDPARMSDRGDPVAWGDALRMAADTSARWAVIVAPGTILHHSFPEEVRRSIMDDGLSGIPWIAQVSNGTDIAGAYIDCGNYLDSPATPATSPLRVVSGGRPSVALVDLERLATPLPRDPAHLIGMAMDGHGPVYVTSSLRYSSLQSPWAVPGTLVAEPLDVDLRRFRPDPTVTVIVRSTANRRHLLTRNLDALAQQRSEALVEVIIVSSEPTEHVRSRLASIEAADALPITVLDASETVGPSRTASMKHAIERAVGEYVWLVDDDDWAAPDAIGDITSAVHARDFPIVAAAVESVTEEWSGEDLRASATTRRYLPGEWFRAFTGWNHLPNCALVFPTRLCRDRLAEQPIVRDLGEDYALQLLMYSTPGATIAVTESTVARVSIRAEGDGTVTMTDRTPWLRDIGSHISDLSQDPLVANSALWALGMAVRQIPYPADDVGTSEHEPDADTQQPPPHDSRRWPRVRSLLARRRPTGTP